MYVFLFLFTCCFSLKAAEKATTDTNKKSISVNEDIALWVDRQARNLDIALAGNRYTKRSEDSQATLTQEGFWDELDGFRYRLDIDLDLALPNLEDKYKIMLSNYNRNRIRRSNYSRGSFRRERGDDYGATLSLIERIGKFDVSLEPRLQFSDGFGTYYNLRLENELEIKAQRSYLNSRFEFFADSVNGTGQFIAFNYESEISSKWSFLGIFEEEYQDAENILLLRQGLNLFYKFSDLFLINNSLTVLSSNRVENRNSEVVKKENFKLQEITLGSSFTHRFLKDELHYSVNYTFIWNREQNFSGFHTASLVVSLIF